MGLTEWLKRTQALVSGRLYIYMEISVEPFGKEWGPARWLAVGPAEAEVEVGCGHWSGHTNC